MRLIVLAPFMLEAHLNHENYKQECFNLVPSKNVWQLKTNLEEYVTYKSVNASDMPNHLKE